MYQPMKKSAIKYLINLGIMFSLLLSCNKDSGPSTAELIIKAPWKFSKAMAGSVDVSALIQSCVKDNLVTFKGGTSTNTGNLNEGATKCNASDPQQIDFTWTYDATFNKITITGVGGTTITILPGGSNEFMLIKVDETEMVLQQTVTFSGTTQTVQVTLIH